MIAICTQVIVNMFQVRVAVQKDLGIISAGRATKTRWIFYFFAVSFAIASPVVLFFVPYQSPVDKKVQREATIFFAIYLVLIVVYSITMGLLYSSIKELNKLEKFSKTQREVLVQFTVFLLAFIVKLVVEAVIWCIQSYMEGSSQNFDFIFSVVDTLQHWFLEYLPVTCMLYYQRKAFIAYEQAKQRVS